MRNILSIFLIFAAVFVACDANDSVISRVKRFIEERRSYLKWSNREQFPLSDYKKQCVQSEEAAHNFIKVFNGTPPTTDNGYICVTKCLNESQYRLKTRDLEGVLKESHKYLSSVSKCIDQCPEKTQFVKIVQEAIPFALNVTASEDELEKFFNRLEQCTVTAKDKITRKMKLKSVLFTTKIALAETPQDICSTAEEALKDAKVQNICDWPEMHEAVTRALMAFYASLSDGRLLDICPGIFEFK